MNKLAQDYALMEDLQIRTDATFVLNEKYVYVGYLDGRDLQDWLCASFTPLDAPSECFVSSRGGAIRKS